MPSTEGDGSALMWHEFRIIDGIYQKWKAARENEGSGGSSGGSAESGGIQRPPGLKGKPMRRR